MSTPRPLTDESVQELRSFGRQPKDIQRAAGSSLIHLRDVGRSTADQNPLDIINLRLEDCYSIRNLTLCRMITIFC